MLLHSAAIDFEDLQNIPELIDNIKKPFISNENLNPEVEIHLIGKNYRISYLI